MAIIPSILYKDSKGETGTSDADIKKEAENLENENEDEITMDEEPVEEVNLEDDEDMQEAINMSNKMVLDAFLNSLPNCVNREMIDSAAAEFCMNHNTKNNRKRLVKALFTVQVMLAYDWSILLLLTSHWTIFRGRGLICCPSTAAWWPPSTPACRRCPLSCQLPSNRSVRQDIHFHFKQFLLTKNTLFRSEECMTTVRTE